jgi:hypothetical protein
VVCSKCLSLSGFLFHLFNKGAGLANAKPHFIFFLTTAMPGSTSEGVSCPEVRKHEGENQLIVFVSA